VTPPFQFGDRLQNIPLFSPRSAGYSLPFFAADILAFVSSLRAFPFPACSLPIAHQLFGVITSALDLVGIPNAFSLL